MNEFLVELLRQLPAILAGGAAFVAAWRTGRLERNVGNSGKPLAQELQQQTEQLDVQTEQLETLTERTKRWS